MRLKVNRLNAGYPLGCWESAVPKCCQLFTSGLLLKCARHLFLPLKHLLNATLEIEEFCGNLRNFA